MGVGSQWDDGFGADSMGPKGQASGTEGWRFTIGNKGVLGPSTHEPAPLMTTPQASAMWAAWTAGGQQGVEAWMASDMPALAAWWAPLEAWERTRLLSAMVRAHAGF